MCFIFFSCCNMCNNYSSKCVEIFIFIISALSFSSSVCAIFFTHKKHISLVILLVLISLIALSFLILLSILLILIWRFKGTINTRRNKIASDFSKVGLIVTIFYLIFMVILGSLIYTKYYDLNHPCFDVKNENNLYDSTSIDDIDLTFEDNKEEFCLKNPNYNSHEISVREYVITYIFVGVNSIFMLCLLYSWFNEFRRIKYLIEGALTDFNAQEIKKEKHNKYEEQDSNEKRVNERINKKPDNNNNLNNKFLYNMYGKQEYGIRYDIYGRPIFKLRKSDKTSTSKENLKTTSNNQYFKRKGVQNKRVSIFKDTNRNSSERISINKFQFSRNSNSNNNNPRNKATTNSNLNSSGIYNVKSSAN